MINSFQGFSVDGFIAQRLLIDDVQKAVTILSDARQAEVDFLHS